jgi:hypothetical protein
MIVNYFDFLSTSVNPTKNDTVLRINSNGVKPFPISNERLQSISRRNSKGLKRGCCIEYVELSPCNIAEIRGQGSHRRTGVDAVVNVFSSLVGKAQDHAITPLPLHGNDAKKNETYKGISIHEALQRDSDEDLLSLGR